MVSHTKHDINDIVCSNITFFEVNFLHVRQKGRDMKIKINQILLVLAIVAGITATVAFTQPEEVSLSAQSSLSWFNYMGDPHDAAEIADPTNYQLAGATPPNCPGSGVLCAIQALADQNDQPIDPANPVATRERAE